MSASSWVETSITQVSVQWFAITALPHAHSFFLEANNVSLWGQKQGSDFTSPHPLIAGENDLAEVQVLMTPLEPRKIIYEELFQRTGKKSSIDQCRHLAQRFLGYEEKMRLGWVLRLICSMVRANRNFSTLTTTNSPQRPSRQTFKSVLVKTHTR